MNTLLRKSFAKDLDKKISEMEVKYRTEQLNREKELAEQEAEEQRKIYLLVFSGILLLTGFVVFIFIQRKNARQRAILQQQRLESLMEGEEKERGRIAKDLHDGIVQDLTAIRLKLEKDGGSETAKEISTEIDQATREVRNIAYQMMPVALREYGLVVSLEDLLQKTLGRNGVTYDFETAGITGRLPEKIEVCLYRIIQELLNNVIRHSKASFVSLVISQHKDAISLVFEDNGTGFNKEEVKKGIGMISLSSRLEIVNGELKLETAEGSGTMVIIRIPLS